MLRVATLLLSSYRQGGIRTWFCGLSRKPEVIGGSVWGILLCARDLSNGTWIIAIGHHSRKLARQVCLFFRFSFRFFCYANVRILQKANRPEFSSNQAANFTSKVQGPTGYPFWRLGGWAPLRGFFLPPQNAPANKKSCS